MTADSSAFTVTVPATTANLGPGFDCLGMALSLANQFRFTPATDTLQITVTGTDADRVTTDTSNLVYQSVLKLFAHLHRPVPPFRLDIAMDVPLARGLGSSATAIVGGLVGANVLAGSPLETAEIMELAIAIEGHPDNVVPALLGGVRLAASGTQGETVISDLPWPSHFVPILGIPDFELSTAAARQVLPQQYSRAAAIFNVAHMGLLVRSLETGNADWLAAALQDQIHQPYRQGLIAGYSAVQTAAIAAGAWGLVISGAGPTLLAIANPTSAPDVATAISQAWLDVNIAAQVKVLQVNHHGTQVEFDLARLG